MTISPYIYPFIKHHLIDKEQHPFLKHYYNLTPDEVADVIITEMGAPADFRSARSRKRRNSEAKKLYCKICVFKLNMFLREVGDTIYGYDHSSVINAHKSFDDLYKTDEIYKAKCNKVLNKLGITDI
jgi:chromosomal replication initiation ATPase DnaA